MFVRCEDCNYENLAQHSFCGMCGAKLPTQRRTTSAAAVAEPVPAMEPKPVAVESLPSPILRPSPISQTSPTPQRVSSGPSLLGLSGEPSEREQVNYLLEDEPSSGRWQRWAAAAVLAAAVAGSGWHWRTEIRAWATPPPHNPAVDANAVPAATAATEPEPANTTANLPPAAPVTIGAASSAPPPSAGASPESAASQPTQAVTDAVARAPETKDEKPLDSATNLATTQPPASVAPQQVTPKIERKAPTTDASAEALETQGENYLYGRGVEADCGRASKSLMAAAARSSVKAQSVLGTLYATGHCVTRDVPTAYRWFAKALHQEPGNVRLQRDLEVLWQQMTPEERELATKTGP